MLLSLIYQKLTKWKQRRKSAVSRKQNKCVILQFKDKKWVIFPYNVQMNANAMLFLKSFNLKSYCWTQDATTDFCKYNFFNI